MCKCQCDHDVVSTDGWYANYRAQMTTAARGNLSMYKPILFFNCLFYHAFLSIKRVTIRPKTLFSCTGRHKDGLGENWNSKHNWPLARSAETSISIHSVVDDGLLCLDCCLKADKTNSEVKKCNHYVVRKKLILVKNNTFKFLWRLQSKQKIQRLDFLD